jgi:hypothetical protein
MVVSRQAIAGVKERFTKYASDGLRPIIFFGRAQSLSA